MIFQDSGDSNVTCKYLISLSDKAMGTANPVVSCRLSQGKEMLNFS